MQSARIITLHSGCDIKHRKSNLRQGFDGTLQRFWVHTPSYKVVIQKKSFPHRRVGTAPRPLMNLLLSVWGTFTDASKLSERTEQLPPNEPNWWAIFSSLLAPRSLFSAFVSSLSSNACCQGTQIMGLSAAVVIAVVVGDGHDVHSPQPLWLVETFVRSATFWKDRPWSEK